MATDTNDVDIDKNVADLEEKMMSCCNLISVGCWGFDDEVKEALKQRKHSLLNRQLNKKEKKRLSAAQKQSLARGIGVVPSTVQEVMDFISSSKLARTVQPTKRLEAPKPQKEKKQENGEQPAKRAKLEKKPVEEEESGEDSEGDDEDDAEKGDSSEGEEQDSGEEEVDDAVESDEEDDEEVINEDEDSTDDEEESAAVSKKKTDIIGKTPKSDDPLDKEIEKLEADEDSESPEMKRQIALLRLQKKLKEMKQDRKGKGKEKLTPAVAAQKDEERRLKRRESKMKLKQRRADEKKKTENVKTELKQEPATENGASEEKVETATVAFNKMKFEIKEDKKGKKQRTAKKDRGLKLTGRDYKSLIAKVEETKATIEKVREADPHKATIMEDELKWQKTMKRAAGGKVKDNLELLKKALAKKNKLKDKKKEKWDNRVDRIDKEKNTKQEKRKANLKKRIDDVKKRKMQKLRKKGRIM